MQNASASTMPVPPPASRARSARRVSRRRQHVLLAPFTLLVLAAWLLLSNHCALAALEQSLLPSQEHRCCRAGAEATGGHDFSNHSNHSNPSDDSDPWAPMMQCCKSLQVALPEAAKLPSDSQLPLAAPALLPVFAAEIPAVEPKGVALETRPPPHSLPFAALVLQDCVRSHAPPLA